MDAYLAEMEVLLDELDRIQSLLFAPFPYGLDDFDDILPPMTINDPPDMIINHSHDITNPSPLNRTPAAATACVLTTTRASTP